MNGRLLGASDAREEMSWTHPPQALPLPGMDDVTERQLLALRVVSGPTGSGKTRALRVLRAVREGQVDAGTAFVRVEENPLWGRNLERLSRQRPDRPAAGDHSDTDFWQAVWRAALLCSGTSVVTTGAALLDDDKREALVRLHALRHNGARLLPEAGSASLPNAALTALALRADDYNFYFDPAWDEIEAVLPQLMEKDFRVHVFVESAENAWASQPMLALKSSRGLVKEVLRLADEQHSLSPYLTVTVAVPSAVVLSLQEQPQGARLRNSERVVHLGWTFKRLLDLASLRISALRQERLQAPDEDEALVRLCGLNSVTVPERGGVVEPVAHYLLRHSSGTPRDVINLVNSLLRHVTASGAINEDEIRELVAVEAHSIGTELLNQVTTDILSRASEPAMGLEPQDVVHDRLVDLIGDLPGEFLTQAELRERAQQWPDPALRQALPRLLWRHGLIGKVAFKQDHDQVRFYLFGSSEPDLRATDNRLQLHPTMLDVTRAAPAPTLTRLVGYTGRWP